MVQLAAPDSRVFANAECSWTGICSAFNALLYAQSFASVMSAHHLQSVGGQRRLFVLCNSLCGTKQSIPVEVECYD